MQAQDFQLIDARGNAHDYTVSPHPTSEGSMLVVRLLGMVGDPIGKLASSNLDVIIDLIPEIIEEFQKRERAGEEMQDEDFVAFLKDRLGDLSDLDLDLAGILRDVQGAIFAAGGDEFLKSLLKHTYRDGNPLSNGKNYDTAYQANYQELFLAVWKVIKVNGFLPSWGIS